MKTDGGKGLRCAKLQLGALADCGGAGGVGVDESGFDGIARDGWWSKHCTQEQRNLYEQESDSQHMAVVINVLPHGFAQIGRS